MRLDSCILAPEFVVFNAARLLVAGRSSLRLPLRRLAKGNYENCTGEAENGTIVMVTNPG